MSFELVFTFKGGPGSGHRGHRGIPGQRGGSLPGTGGVGANPIMLTNLAKEGSSDYNAHIARDFSAIRIFGTDVRISGFHAGSKRMDKPFDRVFRIGDEARIEYGDNGTISKISKKTVTIERSWGKPRRMGIEMFIRNNAEGL